MGLEAFLSPSLRPGIESVPERLRMFSYKCFYCHRERGTPLRLSDAQRIDGALRVSLGRPSGQLATIYAAFCEARAPLSG